MAKLRTSRTFDVLFLVVVALILVVSARYRTPIGDWVFFYTHKPSNKTLQVSAAAGLSAQGTRLLERTNPVFGDQATIDAACGTNRLGCLTSHGRAYVLDVPGKNDQTVVTAVHEMLHLAYERLSVDQKSELAPDLDGGISRNAAAGIQDELAGENDVSDQRDEAHSLLGTEYKNIPSVLEQYYGQYFTDRSQVLAAYRRSEQ